MICFCIACGADDSCSCATARKAPRKPAAAHTGPEAPLSRLEEVVLSAARLATAQGRRSVTPADIRAARLLVESEVVA